MAAVPKDPAGPDLHALEAIPSVPAPVVTPTVSILHPALMVTQPDDDAEPADVDGLQGASKFYSMHVPALAGSLFYPFFLKIFTNFPGLVIRGVVSFGFLICVRSL